MFLTNADNIENSVAGGGIKRLTLVVQSQLTICHLSNDSQALFLHDY